MKRKILVILLSLACVFCLAIALTACGEPVSGNYYRFENQKYVMDEFIMLNKNGTWVDDDGVSGDYKESKGNITFYTSIFGSKEELYSGTIADGIMKLNGFGAEMTFCKIGKAHIHEYGEQKVTKEATCTEAGEKARVCSCGEKIDIEIIPAEHSYGSVKEVTQAPTCVENGTGIANCTRCGTEGTIQIPAIGHDWQESYSYDDAYHFKNCSRCIEVDERAKHDYNQADICTICGYKMIPETDGLEFTLNEDGVSYSVTGIGSVTATKIRIPAEYNGKPVTSIGNYAFGNCTSLESVIIGNSVISIGWIAFNYCTSLESVIIGNSVTEIDSSAFFYCTSLTSITIPDSVTSIGNYAFDGCTRLNAVYITDIANWCNISFGDFSNPLNYAHNLYLNNKLVTELTIPNDVTSIGDAAFEGCTSVTSVTIGNGVISIGSSVFRGCTSLETVYYGGTAEQWAKLRIGSWNSDLTSATRYYFSEEYPYNDELTEGNFWHYDETTDEIVIWTKED